ncbi:MAG: transglutaminase family protein [Xanthobacteraceae bacterium]
MRLRIAHHNVYRYDPPAAGVIQVLRLTPRNHEGQYVVRWRIDVSADARLAAHEDAFGNLTHVFSADGPFSELSVEVDGEVETQNTNGIVRGTVERFAPSLFLRDTALTQADAAIRSFAQSARDAAGGDTLAQLHALLDRLYEEMAHVTDEADGAANAAEGFARKRGLPRDLSHIFIGAAHSLGIPARYVAGYYCADGAASSPAAGHAWAEAAVPDLGWVAFDPAHGCCPTDGHVRVAIGLDSLGAAPVRGMRYGPGTETLDVAIKVGQ